MCDPMRAAGRAARLRRGTVLILGAAVYALLYALCSQIDESGSVAGEQVLPRFALAFPAALAALVLLFRFVMPRLERGGTAEKGKRFFAPGAFAFLIACYGAMFLIQYPGSFMYDTQRQVFQIARGEYEMFHPLLHTLLIRACLSAVDILGSFEKCAALYSVLQLTVVAACFAQVCASVARMHGRRAAVLSALFFGLYPSHMAFASNCTKDGLFSAFFALFFALCFEEALTGGLSAPRRALRLAAGVLACLLRNNMVYALAVWSACVLLFGRKTRRLAVCGVLAIALGCGANGLLQRATDAKDGSVIEMFSIPIQQLSRARLMAPECFAPEDEALMDEVFVDALYGESDALYARYEPTLADPVKNYLDEALVKARFSELAAMWMRVGARCPGVYLDAFLNLALPSLYPYSAYRVAQPYIETGLQPGVVTAPFDQPPMTQPARFEGVRNWLYEHIYKTGADDVPVIRYLFNTGFVFWVLLMIVLYELYSGNGRRFLLVLLPVLLWGTYLLGPVMQGRYLYPFICVLPLFVFRTAKNQMQ
ncbi:MAG: DUF6020 family protein [Candidatus Ventricola sp.]